MRLASVETYSEIGNLTKVNLHHFGALIWRTYCMLSGMIASTSFFAGISVVSVHLGDRSVDHARECGLGRYQWHCVAGAKGSAPRQLTLLARQSYPGTVR